LSSCSRPWTCPIRNLNSWGTPITLSSISKMIRPSRATLLRSNQSSRGHMPSLKKPQLLRKCWKDQQLSTLSSDPTPNRRQTVNFLNRHQQSLRSKIWSSWTTSQCPSLSSTSKPMRALDKLRDRRKNPSPNQQVQVSQLRPRLSRIRPAMARAEAQRVWDRWWVNRISTSWLTTWRVHHL
jgi:hypothetical protein